MSYVEDNLMPNEKVLFSARIHPAVFLPAVVAFVGSILFAFLASGVVGQRDPNASALNTAMLCITGMFFFWSLWLCIQAVVLIATTEFAVTNRRVIAKRGFIRRHTMEMLLQKVESVSVNQDVLGRILNFGTLSITGTGGTKEEFRLIVEPLTVRKKIYKVLEHYAGQASSG